jgi:ribosomal protein L40E
MKKTKPIYFFSILIGVLIMFLSSSMIFVARPGGFFYIFIVLFILIFIVKVAIMLSNGTFEQRSKMYKPCTKCGVEIDINAKFCKSCGSIQETDLVCEYCGHINSSELSVCEKCNGFLK